MRESVARSVDAHRFALGWKAGNRISGRSDDPSETQGFVTSGWNRGSYLLSPFGRLFA
jgi:hypothetical protein